MLVMYAGLRGPGGGLFLTPLVVSPMSVVGGALVGYAISDLVLVSDRRVPRIVLSIVGAIAAFAGPLAVYSIELEVEFFDLAENVYPIGLGLAVVVVIGKEIADGIKRHLNAGR